MIRLFSPLISGGITYPAGTVIRLEPAFEKRIVENGNAEYVNAAQPEPFPADMYQPDDADEQAVSTSLSTSLSTTPPTQQEKETDPSQTVFGRGSTDGAN